MFKISIIAVNPIEIILDYCFKLIKYLNLDKHFINHCYISEKPVI